MIKWNIYKKYINHKKYKRFYIDVKRVSVRYPPDRVEDHFKRMEDDKVHKINYGWGWWQ